MDQAACVLSTPRTVAPLPSDDDMIGMCWWNSLSERDRRHWMRLAGDTGRAVDAWQAYKRLRLAERERSPRDVISEILEEHLMPDPDSVADQIIEHLRHAGYTITPIEE